MRHLAISMAMTLLPGYLWAQITGTVKVVEDGKTVSLPGANVYWEGSKTGTTTNEEGKFSIETVPGKINLTASFIGYQAQSKIIISRKGKIDFVLNPNSVNLNTAQVVGKIDATTVDLTKVELSYKIDDKELRKAACCNLSESFETNASIDVSFTDAVTGTKQIEMLGLAGKYVLIQRENIPFARGINTISGVAHIPGPFIESIQLTKGLSSVLNGYESITGQINVELYKPETAPRLFLNIFGNQSGRMELNAISGFKVNQTVSGAVLFHASIMPFVWDNNHDNFTDIPNSRQINLAGRRHYKKDNGWEGQIGLTYLQEIKTGGQNDFIKKKQNPADTLWGYNSDNNRIELFGKNGYVFKNRSFRSFGFIYSLNYQDLGASFGDRKYFGEQYGIYLNTIYQDILINAQHKYRTGISFLAEQVYEKLTKRTNINEVIPRKNKSFSYHQSFLFLGNRKEVVPGIYFEYTYKPSSKLTLLAGIRGDYNFYFQKPYFTPRLNLRYDLSEHTTLRASGGRGQRSYNAMIENLNVLASSRTVNSNRITGVSPEPEIAWNAGVSITQYNIGKKEIDFTVDAFYTWFDNKLVTDLDDNPNVAYLLNQQGSRFLSLLGQIDYEIIKSFELRLAYKYLNSKDQFTHGLDLSYLIPQHRAFINLAYSTNNNWKFDLTVNWFGSKRLPNSESSPVAFQQKEFSPDFFTVNTQLNKVLKNKLELFVGITNLFDFRQNNPIVNANNPYADYFDTNFIWGPIFGRNIYVGIYYTLE